MIKAESWMWNSSQLLGVAVVVRLARSHSSRVPYVRRRNSVSGAPTISMLSSSMLTLTSSPCDARLAPTKLAFGKSATLGSPSVLATRAPTPARRVDVQFVAGKMKTRKAAAKRYKVTASGKVS